MFFCYIKTVDDPFTFIVDHCSLYDYKPLDVFIKANECADAIRILTEFKTKLENTLLYLLPALKGIPNFQPSGNRWKLIIECKGRDVELSDKNLIQDLECKMFELPETFVRFVTAKPSSVNVIFEISMEVKQHILHYKIQYSYTIILLIWLWMMNSNWVC